MHFQWKGSNTTAQYAREPVETVNSSKDVSVPRGLIRANLKNTFTP